jgi:hypothetical protein
LCDRVRLALHVLSDHEGAAVFGEDAIALALEALDEIRAIAAASDRDGASKEAADATQ